MDDNGLLDPVSDDAPCGDDLEYDPRFIQLEEAAEGKPERQIGDLIEPAEPPDWKRVARLAGEILQASKDLRAAAHLARARAHLDGLPGIAWGLTLVRELLERYWECLHPELDPDDDNDPTIRFNALAVLGTGEGLLQPLLDAPLACAPGLGCFGLRDYEIAIGKRPPPEGMSDPPTEALIEGAFLQTDPETLEQTVQAARQARDALAAIGQLLAEKTDHPDTLPNFERLADQLRQADTLLQAMVGRRQGGGDTPPAPTDEPEAVPADAPPQPPAAPQGIRNRDDVVRMLDAICEFYERHEPASPVPLLMRRARRLVHLDFMAIMRDLAPDAARQLEELMGIEEEES